jgi:hypothetical protein
VGVSAKLNDPSLARATAGSVVVTVPLRLETVRSSVSEPFVAAWPPVSSAPLNRSCLPAIPVAGPDRVSDDWRLATVTVTEAVLHRKAELPS